MNRRQALVTIVASSLAMARRSQGAEAKLRVAVIGHTGHGDYGHGLDVVWQLLPQTEIVALADADETGLATEQKKLGLATGFRDYREMLRTVQPDLVAICPRFIDEHAEMVLAAVESGAKGIYVEKPICRTPAEADRIVAACEARGTKLAIAHRNTYHPALPVVDKLLESDAIGRLLELRGRGKEDPRGGALDLWVLGGHVLSLIERFGGRPLACSASLLQDGRPCTRTDVVEGAEGVGLIAGNELHARFDMERGIPAFFDSVHDAAGKGQGFGLQLIGTKGIIDLRCDTVPFAHILPGSPFRPSKEPRVWKPISSAGVGESEPLPDLPQRLSSHQLAVEDLLAAIAEKRRPLCDERHGRTIVEMVAGCFESHRRGGARVELPLADRDNPLARLA